MKKLLVLVFAIALCLGALCLGASADYSGTPKQPEQGNGTAADPYKITTAEELYWFAGLVNGTLTDVAQDTDANAVCGANYGTITNCYRLSHDTIENDASAKTEAQFASGEVAWLLNSDQEDGP